MDKMKSSKEILKQAKKNLEQEKENARDLEEIDREAQDMIEDSQDNTEDSQKTLVSIHSEIANHHNAISTLISSVVSSVTSLNKEINVTVNSSRVANALLASNLISLCNITSVLSAFRADYIMVQNGKDIDGEGYYDKNLIPSSISGAISTITDKSIKNVLKELSNTGNFANVMSNAVRPKVGNNKKAGKGDGKGILEKLVGKFIPEDMQDVLSPITQMLPQAFGIDDSNIKNLVGSVGDKFIDSNFTKKYINPLNQSVTDILNGDAQGTGIFKQLLAGKLADVTGLGDAETKQREKNPKKVFSALAPLADDIKDMVEFKRDGMYKVPSYLKEKAIYATPVWIVNTKSQVNYLEKKKNENDEQERLKERIKNVVKDISSNKKDINGNLLFSYDPLTGEYSGELADKIIEAAGMSDVPYNEREAFIKQIYQEAIEEKSNRHYDEIDYVEVTQNENKEKVYNKKKYNNKTLNQFSNTEFKGFNKISELLNGGLAGVPVALLSGGLSDIGGFKGLKDSLKDDFSSLNDLRKTATEQIKDDFKNKGTPGYSKGRRNREKRRKSKANRKIEVAMLHHGEKILNPEELIMQEGINDAVNAMGVTINALSSVISLSKLRVELLSNYINGQKIDPNNVKFTSLAGSDFTKFLSGDSKLSVLDFKSISLALPSIIPKPEKEIQHEQHLKMKDVWGEKDEEVENAEEEVKEEQDKTKKEIEKEAKENEEANAEQAEQAEQAKEEQMKEQEEQSNTEISENQESENERVEQAKAEQEEQSNAEISENQESENERVEQAKAEQEEQSNAEISENQERLNQEVEQAKAEQQAKADKDKQAMADGEKERDELRKKEAEDIIKEDKKQSLLMRMKKKLNAAKLWAIEKGSKLKKMAKRKMGKLKAMMIEKKGKLKILKIKMKKLLKRVGKRFKSLGKRLIRKLARLGKRLVKRLMATQFAAKIKAIGGVAKNVLSLVGRGIKAVITALKAIPIYGKVAAIAVSVAGIIGITAAVKGFKKAITSGKEAKGDSDKVIKGAEKSGDKYKKKAEDDEKKDKKLEEKSKKNEEKDKKDQKKEEKKEGKGVKEVLDSIKNKVKGIKDSLNGKDKKKVYFNEKDEVVDVETGQPLKRSDGVLFLHKNDPEFTDNKDKYEIVENPSLKENKKELIKSKAKDMKEKVLKKSTKLKDKIKSSISKAKEKFNDWLNSDEEKDDDLLSFMDEKMISSLMKFSNSSLGSKAMKNPTEFANFMFGLSNGVNALGLSKTSNSQLNNVSNAGKVANAGLAGLFTGKIKKSLKTSDIGNKDNDYSENANLAYSQVKQSENANNLISAFGKGLGLATVSLNGTSLFTSDLAKKELGEAFEKNAQAQSGISTTNTASIDNNVTTETDNKTTDGTVVCGSSFNNSDNIKKEYKQYSLLDTTPSVPEFVEYKIKKIRGNFKEDTSKQDKINAYKNFYKDLNNSDIYKNAKLTEKTKIDKYIGTMIKKDGIEGYDENSPVESIKNLFGLGKSKSGYGLSGTNTDFLEASKYALDKNYKEKDGGTYPKFFKDYLGQNNIDVKSNSSSRYIKDQLSKGNPVLLMGKDNYDTGRTPFGENPHYVVATGYDGKNNIYIEDSESKTGQNVYNADAVLSHSTIKMTTSNKNSSNKTNSSSISNRRYPSIKNNSVQTQTARNIINNSTVDNHVNHSTNNNQKTYSSKKSNKNYMKSGKSKYGKGFNYISEENVLKFWSFLKGYGLSDSYIAGIAGNIDAESGFDPHIIEGGSHSESVPYCAGGYGLIQWTSAGYQTAANNFIKNNSQYGGLHTLEGQLFWIAECASLSDRAATTYDGYMSCAVVGLKSYGKTLADLNALSPEDAAVAWHNGVERSAGGVGSRDSRARAYFEKFAGTAGSGGSAYSKTCWSGDSRTEQMHNYFPDLEVYATKGGQTIDYFNSHYSEISNKEGYNIFCWYGVNGANSSGAKKTAEAYNKLASDLKGKSQVYAGTIGHCPNGTGSGKVEGGAKQSVDTQNQGVEEFNRVLLENLSSDVKVIDTYKFIKELEGTMGASAMTKDNLHYTKECSSKIREYVNQQISANGGSTGSATSTATASGTMGQYFGTVNMTLTGYVDAKDTFSKYKDNNKNIWDDYFGSLSETNDDMGDNTNSTTNDNSIASPSGGNASTADNSIASPSGGNASTADNSIASPSGGNASTDSNINDNNTTSSEVSLPDDIQNIGSSLVEGVESNSEIYKKGEVTYVVNKIEYGEKDNIKDILAYFKELNEIQDDSLDVLEVIYEKLLKRQGKTKKPIPDLKFGLKTKHGMVHNF